MGGGSTVRTTVEQLLAAGVVAVDGRVFQPHMADAQTAKPFLMVREGLTDTQQDWSPATTLLEVWPYVSRGSYVTVDQLAAKAVEVLDGARFTDGTESYLAAYIGDVGEDAFDDQWVGLCRGIRFRVFNLGWLSGLTYDPDPVKVLADWAAATWPGMVQTNPATWAPSNSNPGVYWRRDRSRTVETYAAWSLVEWIIRCHVIAPNYQDRSRWGRTIMEALATARRAAFADKAPLDFITVQEFAAADPMKEGQLALTAQFGILRAVPATTPINNAHLTGWAERVKVS